MMVVRARRARTHTKKYRCTTCNMSRECRDLLEIQICSFFYGGRENLEWNKKRWFIIFFRMTPNDASVYECVNSVWVLIAHTVFVMSFHVVAWRPIQEACKCAWGIGQRSPKSYPCVSSRCYVQFYRAEGIFSSIVTFAKEKNCRYVWVRAMTLVYLV